MIGEVRAGGVHDPARWRQDAAKARRSARWWLSHCAHADTSRVAAYADNGRRAIRRAMAYDRIADELEQITWPR